MSGPWTRVRRRIVGLPCVSVGGLAGVVLINDHLWLGYGRVCGCDTHLARWAPLARVCLVCVFVCVCVCVSYAVPKCVVCSCSLRTKEADEKKGMAEDEGRGRAKKGGEALGEYTS